MKYPVMFEGDNGWTTWIQPVPDNYKFCCCDCGLVHTLQFRVNSEGAVIFRAQRNRRATGQVRRHRKPGKL